MSDVTHKNDITPKAAAKAAAHPAAARRKPAPGLTFKRYFTKAGVSPYDEVEWERRTATISDAQGNIIFEQQDVEVPKDWSMTATNISSRCRKGSPPPRRSMPA